MVLRYLLPGDDTSLTYLLLLEVFSTVGGTTSKREDKVWGGRGNILPVSNTISITHCRSETNVSNDMETHDIKDDVWTRCYKIQMDMVTVYVNGLG